MTNNHNQPKLILVKHSLPHIDPAVPVNQWRLSDKGRQRCVTLAERLKPYQPTQIIASTEPKATETAQHVAARLDLPLSIADGLHEHERPNPGWLDQDAWLVAIATFFKEPDHLVLGQETATTTQQRFTQAVQRVLAMSHNTTVIVAHGTVISLFVAAHAHVEPFGLWQQLGLPSFVVLNRATLRLIEVVGELSEPQ